jgi:hypothetical protein
MAKLLKRLNGKDVWYVHKDGRMVGGTFLHQTQHVPSVVQPYEGRYSIKTKKGIIPITVNGRNRVRFEPTNTLIARK